MADKIDNILFIQAQNYENQNNYQKKPPHNPHSHNLHQQDEELDIIQNHPHMQAKNSIGNISNSTSYFGTNFDTVNNLSNNIS